MMLQPVKRTVGSTFVNATISASKARNFFFRIVWCNFPETLKLLA
jgi:hypothetical protein